MEKKDCSKIKLQCIKALNEWINISDRRNEIKVEGVKAGEELPVYILGRELHIKSKEERKAYLNYKKLREKLIECENE